MLEPPKILKIKDMAQLLGVTRQTIRNMLRDGRCPVEPLPNSKPAKWLASDVAAVLKTKDAVSAPGKGA